MIYKLALLIFFQLIILGCVNSQTIIKGNIIYTVANKIELIDLESKKSKTLYRGSTDNIYNYLNIVSDKIFLVETYNIIRGFQIEIIEISSGQVKLEAQGSKPLYIPELDTLFFVRGNKLCVKKIGIADIHIINENVHQFSKPPIRTSEYEIAYYNKDNKIEIYNFNNKTIRVINNVEQCLPWAYIDSKKSLVCNSQINDNYHLINLNNPRITEKLNIKGLSENIIVTNDYKYLIYSKVGFSLAERQNMYLYSMDDQKQFKYMNNITIVSGIYKAAYD